MIDTLFISGSGVKGLCYIGIYKSLIKNNIINKNIKNLICCSSGCIFGLCLLLKLSINLIQYIIYNFDYDKLLNYNDLNNLLENNGLFKMNKFNKVLELLIFYKFKKKNLSLIELYNKTKCNFIVKVYNYTKKCDEFISYKTNPKLSVIKLIKMSCCLPLIFEPIKYNNCIYIDGGITGSVPFIKNKLYSNYLILNIKNKDIVKNLKTSYDIEYPINLKTNAIDSWFNQL